MHILLLKLIPCKVLQRAGWCYFSITVFAQSKRGVFSNLTDAGGVPSGGVTVKDKTEFSLYVMPVGEVVATGTGVLFSKRK